MGNIGVGPSNTLFQPIITSLQAISPESWSVPSTTEPVELVEPVEPVEPVEQVEPVELVGPVEPVELVEPVEPVGLEGPKPYLLLNIKCKKKIESILNPSVACQSMETESKGREWTLSNHVSFSLNLDSELHTPELSSRPQHVCHSVNE